MVIRRRGIAVVLRFCADVGRDLRATGVSHDPALAHSRRVASNASAFRNNVEWSGVRRLPGSGHMSAGSTAAALRVPVSTSSTWSRRSSETGPDIVGEGDRQHDRQRAQVEPGRRAHRRPARAIGRYRMRDHGHGFDERDPPAHVPPLLLRSERTPANKGQASGWRSSSRQTAAVRQH